MSQVSALKDIVYYIVHNAPRELSITQLMKLVFLSDVEHAQQYGEPLCTMQWTWYNFGPFSPSVYEAVESLDADGLVRDVLLTERREVQPSISPPVPVGTGLSASQHRSLSRILTKYGDKAAWELKQIAYSTRTMKVSEQGSRLNVLDEEAKRLSDSVPSLKTYLEHAPEPNKETRGNPEASAEEDRAILRELSRLRQVANREN